MGRSMTPEKFQSRDVLRRLGGLERKQEYRNADLARIVARIRALEETVEALGNLSQLMRKP